LRYLKELYRFLKHIKQSKNLLVTLSYNDIKDKHLGSYLGVFWAILRPTLFILVIWFIFGIGFKSKPTTDGTPFVLWLLCGFIPWFFFAEAMSKGVTAITGNTYIVKKVAFRVSILPIVKVISAFYIHMVFVFILLIIFMFYGYMPTIYWLQIPFFMISTAMLVLGLGWLTSSIRVFVKDVGEVIAVIVQFGFWLTPIFWSIDLIPESYHAILKANPMFFIVEGYRDALIHDVWFWENMGLTTYFFTLTAALLFVGAIVFKRLRPHFGDVL